jgi:hypothetical protein
MMVALLATTVISCSDAFKIVNRIGNVVGLSYQQKIEVIQVISQHVPSCPIKIIPDERSKSST